MTRSPPAPRPDAAFSTAAAGDSASAAALRRLGGQLQLLRAQRVEPLLREALTALKAGRRDEAAAAAAKALEIDGGCGLAWHVLAICHEKSGDYPAALDAYEQAFARLPEEPEIANDLGRLALKMGMAEIAEALFANYVSRRPESVEGLNNLACAQRDLMKFDEAIETLKAALGATPQSALLWNALASVLTLQGQPASALVFYDEALRLDPAFAAALANRAGARLEVEDHSGALADLDHALASTRQPVEAAGMRVARAKALLASGDLAAGWEAYEARRDPLYEDAALFVCDAPEWTPSTTLEGRRLLLIGEQGLGDEVLFANAVADIRADLGPSGELILAVEPRLASLFARSFPEATVGPHATFRVDQHTVRAAPFVQDRIGEIDAWAPLASPLRRWRAAVGDFGTGPYLKADPARVAHWRGELSALRGPAVGVLWKSLLMDAQRSRYFAPFADWTPVFSTPGASFVNLQYGDCADEAAALAAGLGVTLWSPPGLDLKDDLDEVAALACALDLVIGPANATTNIAAACGATVWFLSTPGAWPRLGTGHFPWYPQARVFHPAPGEGWPDLLATVAHALAAHGDVTA